MGILGNMVHDFFCGKESRMPNYADSDCIMCKGKGVFDSGYNLDECNCVARNRRLHREQRLEAARAAIQAENDYYRSMGEARATETPKQRQNRILGLGQDDESVVPLTPDQQEQRMVEVKLRKRLTWEQQMAIEEGRITECCAAPQCWCGVNSWAGQDLPSSPPPLDHPARGHWEWHRDQLFAKTTQSG